ncbi:hypothetical protein BJ912DRAFT_936334 [Pholiota molesta]|nr:hypothetical protein BJ912DRAFT_936334 [Pholiota molesta]
MNKALALFYVMETQHGSGSAKPVEHRKPLSNSIFECPRTGISYSRGFYISSQIYLDFLSSRGRCSIAGHSGNDFGISREDVPLYIFGVPARSHTSPVIATLIRQLIRYLEFPRAMPQSRDSEFLRDHLRALRT